MTTHGPAPDPSPILAELKDFQRRTVDHVFQRLYLDEHPTRRFLVADEVGLGKTMVARGLIAKTIHHLWDTVDRIDVVYICSNAAIAQQNLRRLDLSAFVAEALGKDPESVGVARARRITMLPLKLHDMVKHKVNFVSLTPGTSFKLNSSLGTGRERALLYWLLRQAWDVRGAAPRNVLRGNIRTSDRFRQLIDEIDPDHDIDRSLAEGYATVLRERRDLEERFLGLCDQFPRSDSNPAREVLDERNAVIGELRAVLARSCLHALEPDLILLDEFQRFKDLLDPEDPSGALAGEFFSYSDDTANARVVLLSATPYKMYTTDDDDTDHYVDFRDTFRFLTNDPAETDALATDIAEHRRALLRVGSGEVEPLARLRSSIEARLRSVICRTERLGEDGNSGAMCVEATVGQAPVRARDLLGYSALRRVSRSIGSHDVLEMWKSAPYLLNFMRDYEFKNSFKAALGVDGTHEEVATALAAAPEALLPWTDLEAYNAVDPGSARLRWLMEDIARNRLWKLLWLPPSLPYYEATGPYRDAPSATKRLIFSAWQVVPQAIASMVSYEVERRMMRAFHKDPHSSAEARKRFRAPLRFSHTDDQVKNMSVLGLLYPSTSLAEGLDPVHFRAGGKRPLAEVRAAALENVQRLLAPLVATAPQDGAEDERWYWAAPILLDREHAPAATYQWFEQPNLASRWYPSGDDDEEEDEEEASARDHCAWNDHVEMAAEVAHGSVELGRPPAELAEVLVELGLGSPAVCGLRALSRVCGDIEALGDLDVRIAAGNLAWGFLTLFNRPENVALVRSLHDADGLPYWRQALAYAAAGNLQAVLDEYVHVLHGSSGISLKPRDEKAKALARDARRALDLRTASLQADDIRVQDRTVTIDSHKLRSRFAIRFADDRGDNGKNQDRERSVRDAFNSPFWPFVLATTSVGQEGLDFHYYCHAVVHWNLPSNPVDLEQREGRVHRYKGHAIRKNVALRYGDGLSALGGDPWEALFAAASADRPAGAGDLVPYWIFQVPGGAAIERHVPALPLSRDLGRLVNLRKTLAVYRMVFGQARQEDLVTFLMQQVPDELRPQVLDALALNLRPAVT